MITYQRENALTLWDEAMPLCKEHWAEIASFKDIPLAPNMTAYKTLEENGLLRCYTARDDGSLIGYSVFIVNGHIHYQDTLFAIQDVLFIRESARRGRAGLSLIKYCDEQLAGEGVAVVQHHQKNEHPKLGFLLAHLGYSPSETLWTKRLDGR